ncbi:MAG: superoxide dismutase family protein [Thermoanaerobaculia bacterium]
MTFRSKWGLTLAAAAGLALVAYGASGQKAAEAKAVLEARSGSTVAGWATFTQQTGGGVKVVVHVEKAPPGTHGLHIHEKGDCSDPEAKSAGGHFNPSGMEHAGPMDEKHHAGDLGNIEVKADGTGELLLTSKMLTLTDGLNSVIGRSVIFHEKADDLKTQPTGNAGGRLACGVVK